MISYRSERLVNFRFAARTKDDKLLADGVCRVLNFS
jgi:hypothetical protein